MTRVRRVRSTKAATPLNEAKEKEDRAEDRPPRDIEDAGADSSDLDDSSVSNDVKKKKDSSKAVGAEIPCPYCTKSFRTNRGLKYHLAKNVCQSSLVKETPTSLPSTKDKLESPANAESLEIKDQDDAKNPSSSMKKRAISSTDKESVENVDEDNTVLTTSPRNKKRQRSSTKNDKQKSPATRESADDTNEENGPILSCQLCNKTFTSEYGLVYHAKHKVCQGGKEQNATQSKKSQEEPYACSVCSKLFRSKHALEYHLKNRVCHSETGGGKPLSYEDVNHMKMDNSRVSSPNQHVENIVAKDGEEGLGNGHEVKAKQVTKRERRRSAINPLTFESDTTDISVRRNNFEQLTPGSKHITKYGIVKVIADDRLPSVHHQSKMPRTDAVQRFLDHKHSFTCKQRAVAETMYTGGRMRREQLKKLYLKSIDPEHQSTSHGQNADAQSIWGMYCHSITPHQILHEAMSWKDANGDPFTGVQADVFDRKDVRVPRDFYPDRIVECVLVNDERKRIHSNIDDDEYNTPTPNGAASIMRLFLARKELVAKYNKSDPNYICSTCRKSFCDIITWKHHVDENLCIVDLNLKQEERSRRLEAREEEMLDREWKSKPFLSSMHAVLKPKEGDIEFGNPCKIKQHKKHKMPSWIVFNDQHSSMYPELFIALKFKRGSQNRNWAGKKKRSEDYVSSHDARLNRKRREKQLLINERAPIDSLRQIHEYALQQAAKQEAAKSERRKRKLVSKPPSSLPVDAPPALLPPSLPVDAPPALRPPSLPVDAPPALPPPLPLHEMSGVTENSRVQLLSAAMVYISEEASEGIGKTTNSNPNDADKSHRDNEVTTSPLLPSCDLLPSDKIIEAGIPKKKTPRKKKQVRKTDQTANEDEQKPNSSSSLPPLSSTAVVDSDATFRESVKEPDSQPIIVPTTATVPPENASNLTSLDNETCMDGDNEQGVKVFHKRNKPNPVVIDTQVLVAECDAGRYPTITRFDGAHLTECVLCTRTDADEDDPLIECDFCKNSAHQICMCKKMLNKDPPIIMRELEPHDSVMCHDCVAYCLARRTRAESRRVSKWHYELSRVGLAHPDAAYLAEEVGMSKSDENTASTSDKKQEDLPTYAPCPNGGPGGLICCSHCTAAYSRYLSNTAKEMEAQSIAKVGQEVNDILDLLADARQRLLNATDVNHSNEMRRKLLKNNEV